MYKYVGADNKFKLNDSNYYTPEANEHYISIHSFINYIGTGGITPCEARVMNELENHKEPNEAMLIGSYVDSYYEGTLEEFKSKTPQLFKKDGTLLAKYEICNLMIERAEKHKLFKTYMTGKKQQIFTGNFGGIDWKIKTDNLLFNKDKECIGLVDLKTCRDIHSKINGYNFIEAWGYDYQLSLYREILKQNIGHYVPCYICAISKEETPETIVISVDDDRLNELRDIILEHCEDFLNLITLKREPNKCNECYYCKSIRENNEVVNFRTL